MRVKKEKKEEIEILEFDEDKKVSKISMLKEFLSDKRNKAIVKLAIYGLFLLIVVVYIRISSSHTPSQSNNNNNNNVQTDTVVSLPNTITDKTSLLNQDKNFNFTINYYIDSDEEYLYIINGKQEEGIISIDVDGTIYYYDENGFYELVDENKNYVSDALLNDLNLYFPKSIYQYLLKSNYQYKKEDLNGNIIINSLINVSDFADINKNIINNDNNIVIETTENSSDTLNVSMDMTNYYNLSNNNISKYLITIEIAY